MKKEFVLQRMADNTYLSAKKEGLRTVPVDCEYAFRPYNFLEIVRCDTEEEALAVYAEYCKHHAVEDVVILRIISGMPL